MELLTKTGHPTKAARFKPALNKPAHFRGYNRYAYWTTSPRNQPRGTLFSHLIKSGTYTRNLDKVKTIMGRNGAPFIPTTVKPFRLMISNLAGRDATEAISYYIQTRHKKEQVEDGTLKAHLGKLVYFECYLAAINLRVTVDRVLTSDIDNYLAYLRSIEGRSDSYIRSTKTILSSFYQFLKNEGILEISPARHLQTSRKKSNRNADRVPPLTISLPEIAAFHSEAMLLYKDEGQDYSWLLMLAAISLSYGSGLRISEVLALRYQDLTLSPQQNGPLAYVRWGKGGKSRTVPLLTDTIRFIELLSAIPLVEREGFIFANPVTDKAVSQNWVYRHWYAIQNRCECLKRYVWHCLRKTCFTEMIRRGATIYEVMSIAGWDDVNTARHYIGDLSIDALKSHRRNHPGTEQHLGEGLQQELPLD